MSSDDWDLEEWKKLKCQFAPLHPSSKTVVVLIFDIVVYLSAITLHIYTENLGLKALGIILLAFTFLHFYLLLHEATHLAITGNRRVNDIIGHFLGWIILLPYLSRQRSHMLHHTCTGHPTKDPANARAINRFSAMTKAQEQQLEFIWRNWFPILVINDRVGLWLEPFNQTHNKRKSKRITKERKATTAYVIGYSSIVSFLLSTGHGAVVFTLYLPALLIECFFEELVNLPHHAETPLLHEDEKILPYWRQHKVTHSCRSIPIWSKWVLLNFNLHTAHHFFPWVPWDCLPEAHEAITQHLPEIETEQQTINELEWSATNRKRPLLEIMGHYLNHTTKSTSS